MEFLLQRQITMNINNNIQSFLTLYFHKIETLLNKHSSGLEKVKFESEESNTDEHLKLFFQNFLKENNDISDTNLTDLIIKVDNKEHCLKTQDLFCYHIDNVLLPNELTDKQKKEIAKKKKSVYTNPDLYLAISDGKSIYYESVELKSTKNNKIPGSSVQQVSPFEWVIFIKRTKDRIEVTTGFYINSITDKLPFPDRSPRPPIGFKTLLDWNKTYRKVIENKLTIENITAVNDDKLQLLEDWQEFLATEWLEIILKKDTSKNEKWFNNALRKFALKLLEYSKKIKVEEREELIKILKKLIK